MPTPNSSNSKLKRYGIPAALVAGGVTFGTIFAPIGLASAEEADNTDDSTEENTDDSTEENTEESTENETEDNSEEKSEDAESDRKGHRFSRRGAKIDAVTDVLGLSAEEVGEGFDAGKSLADLATEQNVPVEDVKAALVAAANEQIDEAVAEGHIDADKAAEAKANVEERVDEMIDRVPSQNRGHSRGGKGHGRSGANLESLSEVLGLSEDEIKAGLAEGKSLAELGEEQGVSAEALADELMAGIEERIDDKVAAGDIDADKAAEMKENLEERIEGKINGEMPERDGSKGHGRRGHRGTDTGAETDSDVQETSF